MGVTFKIWNSSSGSVTLAPEWDADENHKKEWNLNRAPSGTATVYTYAFWRLWKFAFRYTPYSDAGFLNSIFSGTRLCQVETIENAVSRVNSAMITSNKTPFVQLEKGFADRWQGEIELSEY
jgi:hypothetical protein